MAVSTKQQRDFIDSTISQDILGDAIAWISASLSPEDVFTVNELEEWAYENGYAENKEQGMESTLTEEDRANARISFLVGKLDHMHRHGIKPERHWILELNAACHRRREARRRGK